MKQTPDILRPLTAKEKSVLEFIESYLQEKGIAPSYLEIKENFGLASFNSVQRYIQQLQNKNYIYVPGGNLKRAITVLHSANEIQSSMSQGIVPRLNPNKRPNPTLSEKEAPSSLAMESLSLPLLGSVAAGRPIEALHHNEYVNVPANFVRYPKRTYALRVAGESMIEDGIFDGDLIFVQQQETAEQGDTVVAMVQQQATVKRYYRQVRDGEPQIELRPANSSMTSFWYSTDQVALQGIVVGLIRQY